MELTIQRKYLFGLGTWLGSLSLTGQESRNRTKFIEELNEEVKENDLTRVEILKKYAETDKDGELTVTEKEDGTKNYVIPDDKMKDFQKEYVDYLNSDFTIGGPGLKTRLEIIKNIVLNTQEKIDPNTATDYDKWCDAFESMKTE